MPAVSGKLPSHEPAPPPMSSTHDQTLPDPPKTSLGSSEGGQDHKWVHFLARSGRSKRSEYRLRERAICSRSPQFAVPCVWSSPLPWDRAPGLSAAPKSRPAYVYTIFSYEVNTCLGRITSGLLEPPMCTFTRRIWWKNIRNLQIHTTSDNTVTRNNHLGIISPPFIEHNPCPPSPSILATIDLHNCRAQRRRRPRGYIFRVHIMFFTRLDVLRVVSASNAHVYKKRSTCRV